MRADSPETFQTLYDLLPVGVVLEDHTGRILNANAAICSMLGYAREELIGLNVRNLVPPGTAAEVDRNLERLLRGETLCHQTENLRRNGEICLLELKEQRISLSPEQWGILVVAQPVAPARLYPAEDTPEQRFLDQTQGLPVGLCRVAPNGRILSANLTLAHLLGLPNAESLLDGSVSDFCVDPEEALQRTALIEGKASTESYETRLRRLDGEIIWVRIDGRAKRDNDGVMRHVDRAVQDITERRRVEAQLRQAQKLESIGRLAAGVAHDFNNILTVILGNMTLLRDDLHGSPDHNSLLQEALAAGERASNLTRQLLLFSRKEQARLQPTDLNALTANLSQMLRRMIGEDILLELRQESALPTIEADPGMIEQVLMNLAVNARDAMPRGGTLSITTGTMLVTAQSAMKNPEASPGLHVRLDVSDTGCGIPPEIRAHIFEPFFTTKEVGKGTGLGLATVYGIIKQHRGWVELESEPGEGTSFRVYLPAHTVSSEEPASTVAKALGEGTGRTILVVEDEAPVRELIRRILSRQGYNVLLATSGANARSLPWRELERVDLLLTDLVMPGGLSGRDLAVELHRAKPDLPVIYASGYSQELMEMDRGLEQGSAFLAKPFSPRQLLEAVAALLPS